MAIPDPAPQGINLLSLTKIYLLSQKLRSTASVYAYGLFKMFGTVMGGIRKNRKAGNGGLFILGVGQ